MKAWAVWAVSLGLLAAGCVSNPETAVVVAQPKTPISKTLTSFSQAKACMDRLLAQYGKRDIRLTSDGVPDRTGTVAAGTRDMMIAALGEMSERSGAFTFVDIDLQSTVHWIATNTPGSGFVPPRYYIRGSISQVDRNVTADSNSASISLPFLSVGVAEDQVTSVVTVDLQVGDLTTRQVLRGVTTTNTITVVSRGDGASADGLINQGAISINLDSTTTEGTHQALRTLIDYSLIELMGKFTKVPYSRCLELRSTRPTAMAENRAAFDRLTEAQQILLIQRALIASGEYRGEATGVLSRTFRDRLNYAKSVRNLIPNGRIDFELFNILANQGYVDISAPPPVVPNIDVAAPKIEPTPIDADGGRDPIGLELLHPKGALRPGDKVVFDVISRQPAQLYCYYEFQESGRKQVVRVLPNRFRDESKISFSNPVKFPSSEDGFDIVLGHAGSEEAVGCIAVQGEYPENKRPRVLKEPDLTPLASASGLAEVVDQHLLADQLRSSVKVLRYVVQ
ncbi:MAG: DUF4384 domain-containing protein [Minwuia sp.]|uniref:DUF4384 domain-containing protein n=1 Tax=Minwuia sp. TaxID=2493630 RepID=UPI003A8923FC